MYHTYFTVVWWMETNHSVSKHKFVDSEGTVTSLVNGKIAFESGKLICYSGTTPGLLYWGGDGRAKLILRGAKWFRREFRTQSIRPRTFGGANEMKLYLPISNY